MDTGKGRFDMMEAQEAERLKQLFPQTANRIFKVGELVHIKDSFFRIKSLKPTEMRLKLLSNDQSAVARKAEKDAAAHGKALAFVNRAEIAEEATLMRMLAAKDELAAFEMLRELRDQYGERLERITDKLCELAATLRERDVNYAPLDEALDAVVAQASAGLIDSPEPEEQLLVDEAELDEQLLAEQEGLEPVDYDRPDLPPVEQRLQEMARKPCLRHDFSEGRQNCRVCGVTVEAFRAKEAAAEQTLMRLREELLLPKTNPLKEARATKKPDMAQIVAEIKLTTRCNCDLDKWEPDPATGHSFVCRIHKQAVATYRRLCKELWKKP